MDLKRHMQVLLEEKKQIDEEIEKELRMYAELSAAMEAKKKAYKKKENDLRDMKKFFACFAGEEAFSKDSIHIGTLEQEMNAIEDELVILRNKIGDKQKYYEALSMADTMALAEIGTEESCLAAIERLYSTPKKAADISARIELTDKIKQYLSRGKSTEKIVSYLILNYLIYSELYGYTKEMFYSGERARYDNLLREWMPKKRSKLWESIEQVYQSYEIEQLLERCVRQRASFERQLAVGNAVEESFDKTCELIETQMKKILPAVKGITMALKTEKVRRWYRSSFLEVDRLLQQWKSQNKTFQREYERLRSIEKRLRKGREEGLGKKECKEIDQTLYQVMKAEESYVDVTVVKKAIFAMSKEFDTQVKEITLEKNRLLQRKNV